YARSSVEHPLNPPTATKAAKRITATTLLPHFLFIIVICFLSKFCALQARPFFSQVSTFNFLRLALSSSLHWPKTFVLFSRQIRSFAFVTLCSATTPRKLSW